MNKDIDPLDKEIESRIKEMEDKSYIFPEKFSKKDYTITAAVIIICLALIIAGGFLN